MGRQWSHANRGLLSREFCCAELETIGVDGVGGRDGDDLTCGGGASSVLGLEVQDDEGAD